MTVHYSRRFKRQHKKLPQYIKTRAKDRIQVFLNDEFDPLLNNHALSGEYLNCRSIDITGDYRLMYERYEDGTINLVAIGTHSELYG